MSAVAAVHLYSHSLRAGPPAGLVVRETERGEERVTVKGKCNKKLETKRRLW